MKVVSQVVYYPQSAVTDYGERTRRYWNAYKYAMAVKDRKINGYATIGNGAQATLLNSSNVGIARSVFGQWLQTAMQERGLCDHFVVPVPSSDALPGSGNNTRSYAMLEESIRNCAALKIENPLRFKTATTPAKSGGTRDQDAIESNLMLRPTTAKKIVLVDDIRTTGAHLLACESFLEKHGFEVGGAFVCGRTEYSQEGDPFRDHEEDLTPSARFGF